MRKYVKLTAVSLCSMVLFACASGGSGSGTTDNSVTPTNETINPVFKGANLTSQAEGGNAQVTDAGTYIYKFNGTDVNVSPTGISAAGLSQLTSGGVTTATGGTTYSYSRFGLIGNLTSSATAAAAEGFYMGKQTVTMPSSGTATYTGLTVFMSEDETTGKPLFDSMPTTFNVDFGAKSISGVAKDSPDGSDVNYNSGVISGSTFSGTLSESAPLPDDELSGTYSGSFFGPSAQELGGLAKYQFTDGYKGVAAFGAKK